MKREELTYEDFKLIKSFGLLVYLNIFFRLKAVPHRTPRRELEKDKLYMA